MYPSVEIRKENAKQIRELSKKQGMNYYSFEAMLIDFFIENEEYLIRRGKTLNINEDCLFDIWGL